jgi:hypothetical protein
MRKITLSIAALGLAFTPLLFAAPAHAQATRTWVSGVGDDVNPCSRTAPCKTFAGAISKTAANGKINCLDPGGFGAVTITKSLEIDCFAFPGGILSAGTNGINISTTPNITVVLRGIEIHGAGTGLAGIRVLIPANVTIEKCFITAITGNGVDVNISTAGGATVTMFDTTITQAAKGVAMTTSNGGSAVAHIRNVQIHKVTTDGVSLNGPNTIATISQSLLASNNVGINLTASPTFATVAKSVLSNNGSTAINLGGAGTTLRMTDNVFSNNAGSTVVGAGGTLLSGGDNKLDVAGATPGSMVTQ